MTPGDLFTIMRRALVSVAVLLLLLIPVVADEGEGGGDGGIVNLPGCRNGSRHEGTYRLKVERKDVLNGIVLQLPAEVRNWLVVASINGNITFVPTLERLIVLDGGMLFAIKQAGSPRFDLTAFDMHYGTIEMTIEFSKDTNAFTFIVW